VVAILRWQRRASSSIEDLAALPLFIWQRLSKEKKTIYRRQCFGWWDFKTTRPAARRRQDCSPPSTPQQNKEKKSTCGIGGYATVCGGALTPCGGGEKQSTCALVVDQQHCRPVPCRIATPLSVCGGLLSPPPPKKRKNNQQYPFCNSAASPSMPHFPNNKNNQPAALVPVCGGCVFLVAGRMSVCVCVRGKKIVAFGGVCVVVVFWRHIERKKETFNLHCWWRWQCCCGAVVGGDAASSTCHIASVVIHFLWAAFHTFNKKIKQSTTLLLCKRKNDETFNLHLCGSNAMQQQWSDVTGCWLVAVLAGRHPEVAAATSCTKKEQSTCAALALFSIMPSMTLFAPLCIVHHGCT